METASEKGRAILETAKKQVGFIPNMYANMVNSPGVLETYLTGYRLFRESGAFSAPEQEVIFLSISLENGCTYCMAAHSMIADKASKVPADVIAAIRGNKEIIPDAKLRALSAFARTMVRSRGMPSDADVEHFKSAGYTDRHVLEIVLAIAVKTLSNYSNHLFGTEVDKPFADYRWTPA
ncbi:carboxymuconolactone decarboxylase family protein [Noviherbaspirillum pedocola]|nr:carboxymuconolactone decarboxylase family protein [Noviherbaspirillum pedocola]